MERANCVQSSRSALWRSLCKTTKYSVVAGCHYLVNTKMALPLQNIDRRNLATYCSTNKMSLGILARQTQPRSNPETAILMGTHGNS